jgi:hypothetical protein
VVERQPRPALALRLLLLVLALGLAAAGPAQAAKKAEPIELQQALAEVPEHQLLDVGIVVFDPGLAEEDADEDLEELEKRGIFPYLRRSEARYYPFQLKSTLEATGYWGAVRVVPSESAAVDVIVSGEIVRSTGKDLALRIRALDSTGRVWIKEKKYKIEADPEAYDEDDGIEIELADVEDPYQSLFNRIANDLLKERRELDDDRVNTVRTVTELRFAEDLAPDAFEDYLTTDRKGRLAVQRLPAHDDPMLARVQRVRETDYEFIDTLNEFYAEFYTEMGEPYAEWRRYSYEEQLALEKIRKAARMRKILGALLLVGGAVAETGSSGAVEQAAAEAAQVAGGIMIVSGVAKGKDAKTHKETLRELAGSLDAEVEPLLQDVEGRTLRLSGSAEAQYIEFRRVLREIFAAETGLPLDDEYAESTVPDS